MTKRATTPRIARISVRTAVVTAAVASASVFGTGVAHAASNGDASADLKAENVATQKDAKGEKGEKGEKDAKKPGPKDWVSPVDKYELSSTYGTGGNMWASKHSGQDFAVDTGTPVNAIHAGTVVKAGPNGAGDGPAYGNAVVIKHDDGSFSQYAHLNDLDVTTGDKVTTGQHIGESGSTGNSSGPHLHMEIRTTANYGSAIDPAAFLAKHDLKL